MRRETDLAWAAGIIDGEGCIGLHLVTTNTGKCYVLRITVVNTDIRMLEELKRIFGIGSIAARGRGKPHWKDQWYWLVCSKKAEEVLREVEPYLVSKRDQAEIALLSRRYMGRHGVNKENPNQEQLANLKERLQLLH